VLIGEARKKEASVFEQYGSEYVPSLLQALFFWPPFSLLVSVACNWTSSEIRNRGIFELFFKKIFLISFKKKL